MATAAYDPLAPLSPSQINTQAQQTVSAQYQPIYANIDQQASQVQALSQKRAADEQSFNSWMAGQTAQLQSSANTFDQSVMANQSQVQQGISSAYSNLTPDLTAQANNRAGNVSNNAQNVQTSGAVSDQSNFAKGMIGSVQNATDSSILNDSHARAAAFANNLGIAAAAEAKRVSDTWSALSKIGDQKTNAKLKQAADTAKEVQSLLGIELNKANANRNYQAAVAKLNIASTVAQTGRINAQTGQTNAQTNRAKAQADASYQQAQIGLGQQRNAISQQNANTSAGRAADQAAHDKALESIDWYKARNAGKTSQSKQAQISGNTQYAMDTAYASVGLLQIPDPKGTIGPDGKVRQVPLRFSDLKANPQHYVAVLQNATHVNRQVAETAVSAYLKDYGKGHDPRSVKGLSPAERAFLNHLTQ